MEDVSEDRLINISNYISNKYLIDGKGPIIQLRNTQKKGKKLGNINIPHATIYSKKNIPQHFHYKTDNLGDYLIVAEPGWMMYSEEDLKDFTIPVEGMHGYVPSNLNMHGIFYAYGPQFHSGKIINAFELIHIYPLICDILDIIPSENIDGDLSVLKNILK